MATAPQKVKFRDRLKQIGMVFSFTAKRDKLFLPLVLIAVIVPLAAAGIAVALGASWTWLALGLLTAVLAVMIVLNLRSNNAMMAEMAGQPGAAAALIENMRGDWRVTQAVQYTGQFDVVHLVVGRPGVILIGEGNPQRVRQLLGQEKRRLAKVIGSADMRDFIIGDAEGLMPLNKLRNTLMRLPRTISGKEVNALDRRLKALSTRPKMPQGQIPKNMRPKGSFRAMRGR
ncbi:DUF4191 domain-containing protein [Planosporangium mesophilum]|nr:DUF4191 domain-containing protein [Planosporangium mesophilum]NJC83434.1 DUF4191 domain-containing protein [Planosporangium mesophilum]